MIIYFQTLFMKTIKPFNNRKSHNLTSLGSFIVVLEVGWILDLHVVDCDDWPMITSKNLIFALIFNLFRL